MSLGPISRYGIIQSLIPNLKRTAFQSSVSGIVRHSLIDAKLSNANLKHAFNFTNSTNSDKSYRKLITIICSRVLAEKPYIEESPDVFLQGSLPVTEGNHLGGKCIPVLGTCRGKKPNGLPAIPLSTITNTRRVVSRYYRMLNHKLLTSGLPIKLNVISRYVGPSVMHQGLKDRLGIDSAEMESFTFDALVLNMTNYQSPANANISRPDMRVMEQRHILMGYLVSFHLMDIKQVIATMSRLGCIYGRD